MAISFLENSIQQRNFQNQYQPKKIWQEYHFGQKVWYHPQIYSNLVKMVQRNLP